jgi:anti-sigma B factor antagonist
MEIIENRAGDVVIVEPRGRMDSVTAKPFGDRVVELIRSGSNHLLIDLGQVLYISSAGFRSLLIARKLIDEFKGKLVLCGMSPEIKRLFEIGNFLDLFLVCATRDEGVSKAN